MFNRLLILITFLFNLNGFSQDFEVNNYSVTIYIHEDGYFDVVENYNLNFTDYKHGIYRDIQTYYNLLTADSTREARRIKIRNIEVPGHKFEYPPNFVQKISDNLQIKIGDEDKYVFGPQNYEIKYRVYNAFLFEKEHIRFYWNVKPLGWYAVFNQINFSIHLPKNIAVESTDLKIYSGIANDTTESKDFDVHHSSGVFTAQSRSNFMSGYGQSVTVLLNLPVGSIKEIKPWWPFWSKHGWTLILASLLAGFYFIWNKYGKDDPVVATTSYFPPSGIDPAMAGFLINDRADTPDLVSLLPYWGSRGILKMEEIPKKGILGKDDTKITRLRPLPIGASSYEGIIYKGLFGSTNTDEKEILVSNLKNSFYTTMSDAITDLKKEAQIYYEQDARKMQTKTIVGVLLVGFLLFFVFLFGWHLWAALAVIPFTIILLLLTTYLVKKNKKGNNVFSELKGFKNFIKIAEENKLKMLLHDSPTYFESTMGYALAFGLFDKWARKFEALNVQPPSWYSTSTGVLTMHHFANSFSSSITAAQSTMVSAPSSSGGGGSSGGGFGGGGGGSW